MAKIQKVTFSKEQREKIKILKEDEKWLSHLSMAKLRKYSGQYIAVYSKKIVASARSLNSLYRQLDDKKIKTANIRMIEKPSVVIYETVY